MHILFQVARNKGMHYPLLKCIFGLRQKGAKGQQLYLNYLDVLTRSYLHKLCDNKNGRKRCLQMAISQVAASTIHGVGPHIIQNMYLCIFSGCSRKVFTSLRIAMWQERRRGAPKGIHQSKLFGIVTKIPILCSHQLYLSMRAHYETVRKVLHSFSIDAAYHVCAVRIRFVQLTFISSTQKKKVFN